MAFFNPMGSMFGNFQDDAEEQRRREEEERRRLEEQERLRIEQETPVKQTIEIDPATGAQKVKIEGSAYNLSAANPLTPTVNMGPVAPEQMGPPRDAMVSQPNFMTDLYNAKMTDVNQRMDNFGKRVDTAQAFLQDPEAGIRQRLGMTPTTAPATDNRRPVMSDTGEVLGYETPEESVMGAATNAPVAPNAPAATTTAQMTPVAAPAQPGAGTKPKSMAEQEMARRLAGPMETMPAGQMGPAVGQMGEKDWATTLSRSATDPNALAAIRADGTAPEWVRKLAAEADYKMLKGQKDEENATKIATEAYETGNFAKMTREMRKEGGMGDWLKYMFFKSRGYDEAAGEVAERLGLTDTYQTVSLPDGRQVVVRAGKSGLAKAGVDAKTGKSLTNAELDTMGGYLAQSKNVQSDAGTYMDPTGKVQGNWVLERAPGRNTFRQVGTNAIATPDQAAALRKVGVGGTLDDQRARLVQEMNIKLQGKTKEEDMAIRREYNSKLIGQGFAPLQPSEGGALIAPQIGGGTVTTPAAAPAAAPATTTTPAAPVAPAARTAPAAPATPVVPTTPRTAPAAAPAVAPAAPAGGRRPTVTEIEATGTAQKEEAKIKAEDRATIEKNQSANESSADYVISKIGALITDPVTGEPNPGFEVSVGASAQPGFQFIPGTDKATWYDAFDEMKGQQFLAAIKQLKESGGVGALSNQEGEAATKAISRMSKMSNEKEFKRAAQDFQDIVARGVDRNRVKLGQAPKYQTPEQSERDRQDREAYEWLKKNSKDPKAKEVRQRLKDRGIL